MQSYVRSLSLCSRMGGPGRDLHYVVDSEYVERGWGKGCARRRRTHRDLWVQLETAMADCGAKLFLHKVESHLSEGEARQRGEDPPCTGP